MFLQLFPLTRFIQFARPSLIATANLAKALKFREKEISIIEKDVSSWENDSARLLLQWIQAFDALTAMGVSLSKKLLLIRPNPLSKEAAEIRRLALIPRSRSPSPTKLLSHPSNLTNISPTSPSFTSFEGKAREEEKGDGDENTMEEKKSETKSIDYANDEDRFEDDSEAEEHEEGKEENAVDTTSSSSNQNHNQTDVKVEEKENEEKDIERKDDNIDTLQKLNIASDEQKEDSEAPVPKLSNEKAADDDGGGDEYDFDFE